MMEKDMMAIKMVDFEGFHELIYFMEQSFNIPLRATRTRCYNKKEAEFEARLTVVIIARNLITTD